MEQIKNCVVIADDLTGANATGALLKKRGLHTFVQFDPKESPPAGNFDAVIYSTDTRNLPAREAFETIRRLCGRIRPEEYRCISKRIDSTMRGSITQEITAILEHLPGYCAFIVPAFPQAKRFCLGGYLELDGIMLENSDAAADPQFPLKTSRVTEILGIARDAYISMDTIAKGEVQIERKIHELYAAGIRLIVFDCISEKDIRAIASAALNSEIPFICADPGPFTAQAAWQKLKKAGNRILFCIGSVAETTRRQVEILKKTYPVQQAELCVKDLLNTPEAEIGRAVSEFRDLKSDILLLNTDSLDPSRRVDFGKDAPRFRALVNDAVAQAAGKILDMHPQVGAVVCSGGDITVSVCRHLGATGMEIDDEIAPLIASGRIAGGKLRIVTKGGMAGQPDAYITCISYLRGE